jgi:hypothetical protein
VHATITDDHRAWGIEAFRHSPYTDPQALGGFIAEAALRDYLRDELLLDAEHGPKFKHDLIIEDTYRAEVKTQCGIYRHDPKTWTAWIPNWKPGNQHLVVCCYLWVAGVTKDGILAADQVTIRGCIPDQRVREFPMLRIGDPTPLAPGKVMTVNTPQIPDLDLVDIRMIGSLL